MKPLSTIIVCFLSITASVQADEFYVAVDMQNAKGKQVSKPAIVDLETGEAVMLANKNQRKAANGLLATATDLAGMPREIVTAILGDGISLGSDGVVYLLRPVDGVPTEKVIRAYDILTLSTLDIATIWSSVGSIGNKLAVKETVELPAP